MPPVPLDDSRTTSVTRRRALSHIAAGIGLVGGCVSQNTTNPSSDSTPTATQPATPSPTRTPPTISDHCSSDPAIDSTDHLAVSFDSREQFKCRGRAFENFEQIENWVIDAGSVSLQSTDVYEGSQAIALSATETDDRTRIVRRYQNGIDLSGYDFSLAAKLLNPTQESLYVQLLAPDRDNRVLMNHPIQKQWGWTRLDFGPTREVGNPDLTNVREIRIGAYTGADRVATVLIDAVRLTERADHGRLILTFDDNRISQYETAFPILDEYGYPGVAGVIPWSIGESEFSMTLDHVQTLHDSGWDIVSHPQRASSLPDLSQTEQTNSIRNSKQWLIDHGFRDGARFIIWPYGELDPSSLSIARTYHNLGFCGALSPSGLRFTGPLTLTRLNPNTVSLESTKEIISLAAKYNQLITVTFHQVGRSEEQVSEQKFSEIIEHIDQTAIGVFTASDLWEQSEKAT